LVASGRPAHELTVDLIYAEIRQGSRTTINDELKLWKDEQARNDARDSAATGGRQCDEDGVGVCG
jgi:hypothetical protein